MFMVLLVLDDPDMLGQVLATWSECGLQGVTLFETTGLHRRRRAHIPMPYNYEGEQEQGNYTLFAIVPDETMVEACVQATERLLGPFDQPNTGVLAVWPLTLAKGVPKAPLPGGR